MKKIRGRMDESILVCVYYGPNGERLIKRGHKLAQIMDCPLYVLTVDALPYDEFDADKSGYVERWKELCDELDVEEFMIRDDERRPFVKVIAEVAHNQNITQIIIGQSPQNRWEEITKGSIINALLREMTFIDIHIVSIDRTLKSIEDTTYEKGVRAFLQKDENETYRLSFARSKYNLYEGIFYKEIGTDFNNGVFKFVNSKGKTCQVHVTEDIITGAMKEPPNVKK
ncbi:histidine kinase [Oceanobacillus profundus]|uniref:Histidine kinase n=1 Tax=Oceanobacillus profundus TaxID=372463 RepID=A0A417YNN3_9BACI|nr:histidine kinase [Oceanobacillus profundus]MCM3398494.1 histidine kinase [Oceanobacillus profundus]MDO6450227.1 histidine kinase [Oceanobacillus profundus]PAE27239.1 histidine kinase [Paenibacillus sp. 7884-2]RHW35307.1 histidine kinase [Oceanobacillus profundus]